MVTRQIDVAQAEVMRLIDQQIEGVLLALLKAPDLLKSERADEQQRNLSSEAIGHWQVVLQSERYKVDRLEAAFVVIGTMKSGKSTTINAIVGTEVLPNRNQPMTTLPTVIRHFPGKQEPELFFPDPQPMNELLAQLREVLREAENQGSLSQLVFCATEDGRDLARKIMDGSLGEIQGQYKGQREIFDFLKHINDIWRLCSSEGIKIDIDGCLNKYDDIRKFPAIEIEFAHLSNQDCGNGGKFALIDTPGPNEAGQVFLKKVMREQLEKSSAVVAGLDYTQLNAEADAEIRRSLEEVAHVTGDRLFVFVNKFDQKDRNGMDADTLRTYVAKQLFEGRLEESHVYPISSRYGYLATRALYELQQFRRLPDYQFNPWVEDFAALALGACWDEEDVDPAELKSRALKLWRNSRFEAPLTEVVKDGYANSANMSLRAAMAKMLEYNKRIIDSLQLRYNALNTDIVTIEDNIKSLNKDILLLRDSRDEARRLIDDSTKLLQKKIYQLFDKIDKIVRDEIQLVFDRENWMANRLAPYVKSVPADPITTQPSKVHNDFVTQGEANEFIEKLIVAGAETIEPRLQEIQGLIKSAVDQLVLEMWGGVNARLDPALKAAEERLNESFSVTVDFPKPSVGAIEVDFNSLYKSSIKEDEITKTDTRYERKWYTLWCHQHEVIYQYHEHVYRVYTQDVVEQLQGQMQKDSDAIWASLDKYVRNEFKQAIHSYFVETEAYLERFRGDLADAKHDKRLQSERLEILRFSINDILEQAGGQQEEIRTVEENLLQQAAARQVV